MKRLTAVLVGALAAWVGAAHGQTPSQPPVSPAINHGGQMPSVQPVAPLRSEVTLESLLGRLNLNEQQMKLWKPLEASAQAWEQNIYKEHPVWSVDANVVAEMGRLTLNQQNRLSLLEDLEAAIKALYAVLTPEQQSVINLSLLQSIPGVLPANTRYESTDPPGSRKDNGRPNNGGSGRRRGGAMGGFGGMN